MMAKIQALQGQVTALISQQQPVPGVSAASGDPRKDPLTSRRSFLAVPKFSGKQEDWDDWYFRMKRFLEDEPGFQEFIKATEDLVEEMKPTDSMSDSYSWMNGQLYNVLAMNVEGSAFAIVKSLADAPEVRGVNAWMRLMREYKGVTGQRLAGLVGRIFKPTRASKYNETNQAIVSWELLISEFNRGSGTELADLLKIYALKQLVPNELEKDMTRMASTLKTYKDYKEFAIDQVNVRKEPHFMNNHASTKASPMDLDAVAWAAASAAVAEAAGVCSEDKHHGEDKEGDRCSESDGMGMFAFGQKGGADRAFDGECRYCGKYGHRLIHCPVKDADMAQSRNKGGKTKGKGEQKGSYGKGQWKGYPGSKGYRGKGGFDNHKGKGSGGKSYGNYSQSQGKGMYWFDEPMPSPSSTRSDWGPWDYGMHSLQSVESVGSHAPSMKNGQTSISVSNRFQALIDDEEAEFILPVGADYSEVHEDPWSIVKTRKPQKSRPMMANEPVHQEIVGALFKGVEKKACCPVQPGSAGSEQAILAPVQYKTEEQGWVRIRAIPDSGAIESVAPNDMAPAYAVHPSKGSQRGQHYVTAGGDEIPNEGEQHLPTVSADGVKSCQRWQMAAVTRPLKSVGELCDSGNRVVFGRSGGMIQNIFTGEVSSFSRENGTYLMDMWIPPAEHVSEMQTASGKGFPRPGW